MELRILACLQQYVILLLSHGWDTCTLLQSHRGLFIVVPFVSRLGKVIVKKYLRHTLFDNS